MKTSILLIIILLSACTHTKDKIFQPELHDYYKCRLELYCTRSEDSILKKAAFKAVETYFGTNLGDGICERHYQAWGFDYRKPAEQRCGKKEDRER